MAHFKGFTTTNNLLSRKTLLLFMVLLSGHLPGNELPAQLHDKITRPASDQQVVIRYRNFLAVDQQQFHPILESRVNQPLKKPENAMVLPQAGMASDLYKKIGFWMLLLAALFWIIERHFMPVKTDNPGWEDKWHY